MDAYSILNWILSTTSFSLDAWKIARSSKWKRHKFHRFSTIETENYFTSFLVCWASIKAFLNSFLHFEQIYLFSFGPPYDFTFDFSKRKLWLSFWCSSFLWFKNRFDKQKLVIQPLIFWTRLANLRIVEMLQNRILGMKRILIGLLFVRREI